MIGHPGKRPQRRPDIRVHVTPVEPDTELRSRLTTKRATVLGLGGLGSNIAVMLLRSGLNAMTLVDFDRVEEGNLDRQHFFRDQLGMLKTEALAQSLARIDPSAELTLVSECITEENLPTFVAGSDVIIEAVDSAECKALIMNVCMREFPQIPLVTASGLAGYGSTNDVVAERLAENLYVVGDLTSDTRDGHPLFASRVMAAAAAEAHTAIRLLLGFPEP